MARSRANSNIRQLLLLSPWSRHGQSWSCPLPLRQSHQPSSSSEHVRAAAGQLSGGLRQRTLHDNDGSRDSRLTTHLWPSRSAALPHQFTPRFPKGSGSLSDGIPSPFVRPLAFAKPARVSPLLGTVDVARMLAISMHSCIIDDNAISYRTGAWQSRHAGSLLSGAFATIFGLGVLLEQFESEPAWSEEAENSSKLKPEEEPELLAAASLAEAFLEEIKSICDEERITLDEDDRGLHGKPWNSYHTVGNIPDIVVYPKTVDEVVGVVKLCEKYKVPVTPYGAATSLEGHTVTPYGGVSLDMTMMKEVKALHLEDMDVTVEPGIGWQELNEYLKPYGLFFPLDPGPGATIGGMCATRCSGSLAMRYGTMRDNVIALKAVMANGDVVKTASRARKSAAGYDLTRLLIGSEGTLGVITEVTLRLQKIPPASTVAMSNFPTIKDAADVAIAITHSGIQASRIELLDEVMMKAVNMGNGTNYPEEPTLMFELVGTEAYVLEQTQVVKKIAEEHQSSDFVYALTPEEKVELWKVRKEAFWSALLLKPNTEAMTTDVCVPLSKLADCIGAAKLQLDTSPLMTAIISHAGDGNFHTVILFDPKNKEEVDEAHRLADGMVQTALALDGTCTGEHGVGVGKIKYLEKELGPEAMRVMGTIKESLDPGNVMNPGKVIPPQFCY